MKNHLRVVRSSGMYCKYLSKRPLLIFLRSFLSFQEPAQRDSQLFWRSWAQSLWWSFCHMDITLVDLILVTSDQGLLVIHLPSLTQGRHGNCCWALIPQLDALLHSIWVMYVLEDGGTLFCYLHLHVLGFTKLHKVGPALLVTSQWNTDY